MAGLSKFILCFNPITFFVSTMNHYCGSWYGIVYEEELFMQQKNGFSTNTMKFWKEVSVETPETHLDLPLCMGS